MKTLRKKPRCTQLAADFRAHGDYLPPTPSVSQAPLNASLDKLPAEMKVAILEAIPDLPTLRSLVHASPAYHHTYIGRRQEILSAVLVSDMGPEVFVDASTLLEACTITDGVSALDNLEAFTTGYQANRALGIPPGFRDMERLVRMAQFHWIIHAMSSIFSQDALSVHPVIGRLSHAKEKELSPTETRRFQRAFYRFQIICVLFGECDDIGFRDRSVGGQIDQFRFSNLLLSTFEPWEVEEINCIILYVFRYYYEILEKAKTGVDFGVAESSTSPRNLRPYPWGGAGCLTRPNWYRHGAESCTSLGLRFLKKAMAATSLKTQVHLLEKNVNIGSRLVSQMLWRLPLSFPLSPEHQDHAKAELHFVSDEGGPNAAWVWSRGYTYYLCTPWPGKDWLLFWAYVMWDFERLEQWKVLTVEYQLLLNWYTEPECVFYPHGEVRRKDYRLRQTSNPRTTRWLHSAGQSPESIDWFPRPPCTR